MPPRPALREIDANRPVGHELSVNKRAQIVGAVQGGAGFTETAQRLDLKPSTVKTTLRREPMRHANESLPRTGRPKATSARDVRTIVRYVRINPKHTYRQIRKSLQLTLSSRTIKRILEPFNIRKWQCAKRPELSEEVAKLRHEWVLLRKDWSVEEWAMII